MVCRGCCVSWAGCCRPIPRRISSRGSRCASSRPSRSRLPGRPSASCSACRSRGSRRGGCRRSGAARSS
ncbi:hypothetical protein R2601_02893 [Salipiger bermudensis HTCC2601]|uniref:Uncharacterized protein n=1 Tax=Salipiger bermudensis (strain DSM 26914 / JCM 13377 / KCTC 12554 / HTCC2601) TaxID=314265 RepID=Q0FWR7_SALBH|nr:hypothetical protein R2601_02893 [Salipiger bermudensis HTCC2601]